MCYVYLLQHEETKEFYVGYTNNLEKRIEEHNRGDSISTKRNSGIWILIYYESYRSEYDARDRERKLKYHGKGLQLLLTRISKSKL